MAGPSAQPKQPCSPDACSFAHHQRQGRSISCDDPRVNDFVMRAQQLLEENQYLTLATSDASGRPWSSTVWYTAWQRSRSEEWLAVEFIWLSRPDALHSKNLLQRPEVGISIFNSAQPAGTGDGLQFAASRRACPVCAIGRSGCSVLEGFLGSRRRGMDARPSRRASTTTPLPRADRIGVHPRQRHQGRASSRLSHHQGRPVNASVADAATRPSRSSGGQPDARSSATCSIASGPGHNSA